MNLVDPSDSSCLDKTLKLAVSQQLNVLLEECRNVSTSRLSEIVQKKLRALEAEHSSIVNDEIAHKAEALSKKFVEIDKEYENGIAKRENIEVSSKAARIRYDKLNVRFMNSGLRISQLKPRAEQMDPHVFQQKTIQNGVNFTKGLTELQLLIQSMKSSEEERDEMKTKMELARNDKSEFTNSLKEAKFKFQRETDSLTSKENNLQELRVKIEQNANELDEMEKQIAEVKLANEQLRESLLCKN